MRPYTRSARAELQRQCVRIYPQLDNSGWTAREAADAIAEQTESDVVQVIGNKFVLFKRNEKEPVIENIPKAK